MGRDGVEAEFVGAGGRGGGGTGMLCYCNNDDEDGAGVDVLVCETWIDKWGFGWGAEGGFGGYTMSTWLDRWRALEENSRIDGDKPRPSQPAEVLECADTGGEDDKDGTDEREPDCTSSMI